MPLRNDLSLCLQNTSLGPEKEESIFLSDSLFLVVRKSTNHGVSFGPVNLKTLYESKLSRQMGVLYYANQKCKQVLPLKWKLARHVAPVTDTRWTIRSTEGQMER